MNGGRDRSGGRDGSGAPSEGDLSGRLQRLGAELEARRPAPSTSAQRASSSSERSGLAYAFRASSEFIAGVVVGGGLGWAFDKALGTSPWGLIVFLLLGFAAGVLNVLRTAGAASARTGGDRRSSD